MEKLPPHLRLGITLPGMRELFAALPADAVDQVNAGIPLDKRTGAPKFPKNDAVNGYVNQFFVTNEAKADRLGVCERLKAAGSPHVGEATVFVSWFLGTSIATLLDALGQFLKQHGLDPSTTFFWVCDYVIRQTDVGPTSSTSATASRRSATRCCSSSRGISRRRSAARTA